MALDYDFWISDLGFNYATSADRPYERATAQFRKDQLDQSATVGDQSLVGWWTRGQLSFHKGAGIKYYEVLGDSDSTIDGRFRTSLGVDPWTPGEVTLSPGFDRINKTGILDLAPFVRPAVPPITPTEMVSNTGFETNTTGWESNTGLGTYTAATSFVRSTAKAHSGSASLLATWPTATRSWVDFPVTGLTVGRTYEINCWVWSPTGAPDPYIDVLFFSSSDTTQTKDAWVNMTHSFVAEATTHYCGVAVANCTSGQLTYVDDFSVMEIEPIPSGALALLSDGLAREVGSELGSVRRAYNDQGILTLASSSTTPYACTPDSIDIQKSSTVTQHVTNPTFDNAGDKTWASAQGASTLTWNGTSLSYTTAAATDGVRFTIPVSSTATTRTNLMTNGSFEANVGGGWTVSSGALWRRLLPYIDNPWSPNSGNYALAAVNMPAGTVEVVGPPITMAAATSYATQVSVSADTGSQILATALKVRYYDVSGAVLSTATLQSGSARTTGVTTLSGVHTSPASTVTGRVVLSVTVPALNPELNVLLVDKVMVEQSTTVGTYFNGSVPEDANFTYSWTGAPHASTSVAVGKDVEPVDVLFRVLSDRAVDVQHWNGSAYVSIGHAGAATRFERLLATDTSGNLRVQIMGLSGSYGATSLTTVSVTDSLAEGDHYSPVNDARWSWVGSTNSSKSTRSVAAGGFTPLWRPPDGYQWAGCWYAKRRLLAVDTTGRWYSLSATESGQAATADVFWSSFSATGWSVAESPSAIFLARANEVYSISLDSTGLIPSLDAAAVAAQLPVSETISSIAAYLGYLVICTNRGVRVALMQDAGALAYGPRFISGDFSRCNRIATNGDFAYVTGVSEDDNDSAVYSINLTEFVSTLVPAFARWLDVEETPFGGTLGADGVLYFFDSTGVLRQGTGLGTSGTLTTGFHRLGTLDPKSFRLLRVKTEGTVGSVAVSVVEPDGTVTSVGTVSAGSSSDLSLTTALTTPLEYIALKFTLTGNGTAGPTLLGYQLKALPVPKRQRMIRVPLMLFDTESNRSGQNMRRDPWTRLAALEALEESASVTTFTDRVTGETGSAYVESVEVKFEQPPNAKEGVGGFIFVTLRKV